MNDDTLAAIRGYIADGGGMPYTHVIPANDNAPIPGGLFVSVRPYADDIEGEPCIVDYPSGARVTTENRTSLVSAQFHRTGAYQAALKVSSYIESDSGSEAARGFGVGIEIAGLNSTPAIVADKWEERWILDLLVGYVRTTQTPLHFIEPPFPIHIHYDKC